MTLRSPAVGIVGAGQLARMTIPAAIPLGIQLRLLAERRDDSAALVWPDVEIGSPVSSEDLTRFAASCDVLTFDHELVDAVTLQLLAADRHVIRPSADVMALVQDKARQRATLNELGLPVPAFQCLDTLDGLHAFGRRLGWPVVVKAARGGYDGRGVWVLQDANAADDLVTHLGSTRGDLLVEEWIPIERELAALVARRPNGALAAFPLVETVQIAGICRELVVPARVPDEIAREATAMAETIASAIGLVGMLAVELFQTGDRLIVNELAARPHNSGHFSIEGCVTSQFEQHLRAILDWPLGDTTLRAPALATVNVLGGPDGSDPSAHLAAALAVPDCHVHLYGKTARLGRKLGHVTALGGDPDETLERARRAAEVLAGTAT